MNPPTNYNTMDLLHTSVDAVYVVLHNVFRLLKPVRRKYKLSVNSLIVLNAIYLYHKYRGSMWSVTGIVEWLRYFDRYKMNWYMDYLEKRGLIYKAEKNKNIQYYKITDAGVIVMKEFEESYQSILYKWYNDNGIVP